MINFSLTNKLKYKLKFYFITLKLFQSDNMDSICNKCKRAFTPLEKAYGKFYKTCPFCRERGLCVHNKNKYLCKDCGGKGICLHNRNKYTCRDCGGSQICPHKKQKSKCTDCKGSQVCPHDRQKGDCILCRPEYACQGCKCIGVKYSKYRPYCFQCYQGINKEEEMFREFLQQETFINNCLVD